MKKIGKVILWMICIIVVVGGIVAWQYYSTFQMNNVRSDGGIVKIYRNMSNSEAEKAIIESGALINNKSFGKALKIMIKKGTIEPGLYQLKKGMNNKLIVRTLVNGWQTPTNLVISGYIRSRERLAAILGSKLEADSVSFITALNNETLMESYGFNNDTYLGMIIPNTYEVYWTITPVDLLDRMKKEYDNFWNEERVEKANLIGLSKDQVSTLAAIVIEESKYVPEQPTIAGVYMNRLKKGMPLQADPTVKFAINDPKVKRILQKHLQIDSPYNTYKYKGLPPGPITIPPVSALDAVLNYEHHNYIYFCAKATFDGQHNFASSYSQHLQNARAYQRAFTEREKLKASAQ
ncbi:MAG: endolytic transglycosylase MltG [Bacteroidales bacterium]|nr:endolytic transglycosylase MltG [Bacteroidales bacterium]MDD3201975.1 endolytic transglycosylase MltG [Bacteroidales bacterium]